MAEFRKILVSFETVLALTERWTQYSEVGIEMGSQRHQVQSL